MDSFYIIALVVFFIGWLLKRLWAPADFIAVAGASLFVLVWLLRLLNLV